MRSVAVIVACHNRRPLTLRCLGDVFANAGQLTMVVYLLDDASTDGTADAVGESFPDVKIIHGDGSYFWNRGMATAFGEALARGYDFYLWVNDDVAFDSGFLARLIETHDKIVARTNTPAIVVGSCRSEETGAITYGGVRRLPSKFAFPTERVLPGSEPFECDTFDGNCVLVSGEVAKIVGNLDPVFFHGYGDKDYGLRARAAGCRVWVAPGTVGICERNPRKVIAERLVREGSLRERWNGMSRPEYNFHFPSWIRFTRRHVRPFWPIAALGPLRRLLPYPRSRVRQRADDLVR